MGKQKYTIDDVKNFLLLNDNENECILLSEQYESSKKPLLFQCKICGNEFSRSFEALKTVKHFCCPKCARSKSGGNHDRKTIDDVKEFLKKNDVNNECELISTEFVNSSTPLLFKCNVCHQIFQRTFSQLQKKNRLFCCPQCGSLRGSSEKFYSTEYVRDYIKEHDQYILLGDYVNSHSPIKCQCKSGHIFNLYWSEYLCRHRGCPKCSLENHSKENHWNWNNGGYQETLDALRHAIIPWKKECLKNAEYKCDISNEHSNNLVVHHIDVNFRELVNQALKNTNLDLRHSINEYSLEERTALEEELLRLHRISNGVVIKKEYHDLFHKIYGKTNNNRSQYEKFKKMILQK